MATQTPCNTCPHCHQRLPQPRPEALTPKLADALAQIAKQTHNGQHYVKVEAYRFQGCHARLALWGLAEELLHEKKKGAGQTRSGSWRPTQKGMQWLSGLTTVPSEVCVLRGKVVGLGRDLVTFEEAMASSPAPAKGTVRNAADAEGERLFLQEQARLERSYLEEDEDDDGEEE